MKKSKKNVESKKWTSVEEPIVEWIARYLKIPIESLKRDIRLIDLQEDFKDCRLCFLSYEIEDQFGVEFEDYQDAGWTTIDRMVKDTKYLIAAKKRIVNT